MQRSSFPSSVQASLAGFGQQFCYCILQPKGNYKRARLPSARGITCKPQRHTDLVPLVPMEARTGNNIKKRGQTKECADSEPLRL